MAHNKLTSKKRHLAKHGKRTRWAPFWTVFKVFGKGKRVHPARITRIKRQWRRSKLHIKPRRFKSPEIG